MRLFKSRKSADYSNVSSVVANENDPHVTLSSICQNQYHWRHNSSAQEEVSSNLHNNNCNAHYNHFNSKASSDIACKTDDGSNKTIDNKARTEATSSPSSTSSSSTSSTSSTNYDSITSSSNNNNNNNVILDKFTPIPDCDVDIVSTNSPFEQSTDIDNDLDLVKQQEKTDSNGLLNEILATIERASLQTKPMDADNESEAADISNESDSLSNSPIRNDNEMPTSASTECGKVKLIGQNGELPDYRVVKAVPVIILDNDVPKETKNMFTWGRRMSKKFELLRRSDSRKPYDSTKSAAVPSNSDSLCERSTLSLKRLTRPISVGDEINGTTASTPIITNNSFKTFFHRIGSTGMLSRSNTGNAKQANDTRTLYRSSSTSQLNTSSYIKGEDPTDGVNLCTRSKVAADLKNHEHSNNKNNTNNRFMKKCVKAASFDDIARVSAEVQTPPKFPYAFLRSKLSVLPEENGGSVINHKRALRNALSRENSVSSPLSPLSVSECKGKAKVADDNKQEQNQPKLYTENTSKPMTVDYVSGIDNVNNNDGNGPYDWEKDSQLVTYQRLNSCFSSNESGYDSDSRQTDEQNVTNPTNAENGSQKHANNLLPLNSSINSALPEANAVRRRYRLVKLERKSPNDFIGIEMSPQLINTDHGNIECRYVVAEISVASLAHTDGRLRIGDEIVNVNGEDLRGMQSYETVQKMLTTFVDDSVELVIAHDELTTFYLAANAATNVNTNDEPKSLVDEVMPQADTSDGVQMPLPMGDFEKQQQQQQTTDHLAHLNLTHIPKNNGAAGNKGADMLPLHQNSTEYVPVYGSRSTISTTISDDEKWQILSKKRSEFLSKYGYSSQTGTKDHQHDSDTMPDSSNSSSSINEFKPNLYTLNRIDLNDMPKRYSYCEYKPLSARNEVAKLKFPSPFVGKALEYRSIRFNRDLLRHSCDLSNDLNGYEKPSGSKVAAIRREFEELPLIGDSAHVITNQKDKNIMAQSMDERISIKPITDENDASQKSDESSKDLQKHIYLKVRFNKGFGMKSLGFSIVGGKDSPKGNIGIFVKRVFASGQAADNGNLLAGDEILALNNESLQGMSHLDTINMFKNIKEGPVVLNIARRRTQRAKSLDSVQFQQN